MQGLSWPAAPFGGPNIKLQPTIYDHFQLRAALSSSLPLTVSLKELEQSFHGATFLLRDKNSSKEREGERREREREGGDRGEKGDRVETGIRAF